MLSSYPETQAIARIDGRNGSTIHTHFPTKCFNGCERKKSVILLFRCCLALQLRDCRESQDSNSDRHSRTLVVAGTDDSFVTIKWLFIECTVPIERSLTATTKAPSPPSSPIPTTHASKLTSAPTSSAETSTLAPTSSPRTPQQFHQVTTETTKASSNTLATASFAVSSSSTVSQTGTTTDSDTQAATPAIPCLPIQPQSSDVAIGGAEPQSMDERPNNDGAVLATVTSNKATDFRATGESTTTAISLPAATSANVGEAPPPSAALPSSTKASPRTPDPSNDEEKYTSSAAGDINGGIPRKQGSQLNDSGNSSSDSRASDTASRDQLFWNPFFLLCASLLAVVGLVGSVIAYRAKQQRQMRHCTQQVVWRQHLRAVLAPINELSVSGHER